MIGPLSNPPQVVDRGLHHDSSFVVIDPFKQDIDPARWARRQARIARTLAWGLPLLLISLWEIFGRLNIIDRRFIPAPEDLVGAWRTLIVSGAYFHDLAASLNRLVLGFSLGSAIGFVLGALLGNFRLMRSGVEPTLVALYTIPKLSILPLLIIIFGLGELTKVLIVALSAFFVMVLSTTSAVASVSSTYIEAGRSLGAKGRSLFWHVS